MGKTTPEVRRRVRTLGIRITELQAGNASQNPSLAAVLSDLQTEQAVWKLLLVTRRLQLHDRVVNLARWRDGYTANPMAPDEPRVPTTLPDLPSRTQAERRGE